MVDEAHERSISTDILLGPLKKIQKHRPELRLIISSATIEAKSMSNFFQSSKRRRVLEGKELRPSLEPAILSVEGRGFNVQIHYIEDPVQDYVQAAVSTVLLIHDQEAPGDILVFLTGQDDIDVAVKLLTEEARSNGKNSSGLIILPLYSGLSHAEQDLVFSPTPKGKRKVVISTNIAETLLTLEGVVYVVDNGFSKQRFYNPEQMISKMILAANELGCSEEIITIAAVLSIQSIWFSGRGAQKDLDEAKLRFAAAKGDHVTFLNIYKGFLQSGKSSKWCPKNFLNYHAMKKVMEIKELKRIALRLGIVLKSCERDMQSESKVCYIPFSCLH